MTPTQAISRFDDHTAVVAEPSGLLRAEVDGRCSGYLGGPRRLRRRHRAAGAAGGYALEDGELRARDGTLLLLARQLRRVLPT